MDSIFKLGFQKKETVRQAAGESLKRFIVIAIVAGLPAFLEGFDGEIYSFGSTYIVPALTGPHISFHRSDTDWIRHRHSHIQPGWWVPV